MDPKIRNSTLAMPCPNERYRGASVRNSMSVAAGPLENTKNIAKNKSPKKVGNV
jgi:hypothetical protein